jgi:TonB family protein
VLLGMAVTPVRPARFASVPRAVGESIQYATISMGTTRLDRGGTPHRRARAVLRPPRLGGFDFTFALNLVSSEPFPDPEPPSLSDSLFGDPLGRSPFSPSNRASEGEGIGVGGGVDSVAYIAANVDKSAESTGANPKPAYPPDLLNRLVEASFSVYFVVDTTGRIDTTTIQVPPSVDRRFAKAVLDVLPRWHFVPAEIRGRRVRQLMEQPFEFRIVSGQYT